MGNLQKLLPIFAAVCFLAGAAIAADVQFQVEGRVYCDNCRAGFITNITEYIEGATVRLQCTHFPDEKVEHSVEAVTGTGGYYSIAVPNDHEEEVCYVQLVNSPRADCGQIGDVEGEKARILLTENSGQADHRRYANSLGFLKDTALPICPELLKAYALDEDY